MVQTSPQLQQAPTVATSNNGPRPLSDIRELSEPSIIDNIVQRSAKQIQPRLGATRANSLRHKASMKRAGSVNSSKRPIGQAHARSHSAENGSSSYSSTPEPDSFYSIPKSSVPRRSSSQTHAQRPTRTHARKPSIRAAPPSSHQKFEGFTVPNRGQSRSPVKEAGWQLDAVKSDTSRRVPSRTHVRTPHPTDMLDFPSHRHPRVKLELQVSAPLFAGGGSVEGQVKITVDENERLRSRRSMGIGAVSVDLLGFEDMPGSRKATFLAVGTELLDTSHPPPPNMVEPANPLAPSDEKFWTLSPSTSTLPFMISLPLDTGPPPFQSKIASVRFLLCATALIRDAGKQYRVRTSQDIPVLATYDPEKALTSLPSPLTAADELSMPRFGRCETVRLTAGLHRQVWVSGSSIFVDVHIANKSHKPVKRLELNLERDILCYKHAPAATREKSASHARIFESNEQTMITRSILKPGTQGWNGIEPHSSETRTCELELPRGHATVRCGKFFEVRFFLNVTASLSNTKLVSVQLPIILIHINSLDVLPNSVAQVAAAIEERRAQKQQHQRSRSKQPPRGHARQRSSSSPAAMTDLRRNPSYSQGRAFAAPRQQSLDHLHAVRADIDDLQQTLDSSPRKYEPRLHGIAIKKMSSNMSFGALRLNGDKSGGSGNPFASMAYQTPPTNREGRDFDRSGDKNVEYMRDQLRRMRSFESVQSRKSATTTRSKRDQNTRPKYNFTVVRDRIEPHALGLTSTTTSRQGGRSHGSADPVPPRPSTGLSFREKLDRSRFEFKGVRRKGSLKERGMNWWEQVKQKDKEREGWI